MGCIAHHDHGQQPTRMQFLRIIFGYPEGTRKWRILQFCYTFAQQNPQLRLGVFTVVM